MSNDWLKLKLVGKKSNRAAIGARVTVAVRDDQGPRKIHRVVGSGGSFGASSFRLEIGLGKSATVEAITVLWPVTGQKQVLRGIAKNKFYRIVEGEDQIEEQAAPSFVIPAQGSGHHHP